MISIYIMAAWPSGSRYGSWFQALLGFGGRGKIFPQARQMDFGGTAVPVNGARY
jgi:hypothetical protein